MNRVHIAGITLALAGLSAGGVVVTTDLAGADAEEVSAQPAYLTVLPGEVTPPVKREAVGVREHRIEAAARQDRLDREAARALAARKATLAAAAARALASTRASRSTSRAPIMAGDPRAIARAMLANYGWAASQFGCLDSLWERESGWSASAENSSSGAYGIPQALPGSKMATAGADWQTNPATQISWGLGYIRDRYSSPCGAWSHFQSSGWY